MKSNSLVKILRYTQNYKIWYDLKGVWKNGCIMKCPFSLYINNPKSPVKRFGNWEILINNQILAFKMIFNLHLKNSWILTLLEYQKTQIPQLIFILIIHLHRVVPWICRTRLRSEYRLDDLDQNNFDLIGCWSSDPTYLNDQNKAPSIESKHQQHISIHQT